MHALHCVSVTKVSESFSFTSVGALANLHWEGVITK